MALPLYLAMTAGEIQENSDLPPKLGYMACHFSPYGTGLSNLPNRLPAGSLLILNDRTPIRGHDPELIRAQLEHVLSHNGCRGLLLDFQQPEREETAALATRLAHSLPCPVGLSHHYEDAGDGPVFLPPPPPDIPLAEYLQPRKGREIWLEAALDTLVLSVTDQGCTSSPLPRPVLRDGFPDRKLHCHYQITEHTDRVDFTLFRTREDLTSLLAEAENLGVAMAVGLWQELR